MIYFRPTHFVPQELVSPEVYHTLGNDSILVMDYRILKTVDLIREYFKKPVIINNWSTGGQFENRGYRSFESKVGAQYSQHKFGRAVDLDVVGVSASDVRKTIMNNQSHFSYITCMEDNVNWVHIDCRATMDTGIVLFDPNTKQ